MLRAVYVKKKDCDEYVASHHRHHQPLKIDLFRIGAVNEEGELVGVCQVMRPAARKLCDGKTVEVARLCTNGSQNVCSFLYSRAARIAREFGFSKIITYILDSESGVSLRASGWRFECMAGGVSWNMPNRQREDKAPVCPKQRWSKILQD